MKSVAAFVAGVVLTYVVVFVYKGQTSALTNPSTGLGAFVIGAAASFVVWFFTTPTRKSASKSTEGNPLHNVTSSGNTGSTNMFGHVEGSPITIIQGPGQAPTPGMTEKLEPETGPVHVDQERGNYPVALFDLVYYGLYMEDYMHLTLRGMTPQPTEFYQLLEILGACVQIVMDGPDRTQVSGIISDLHRMVEPVVLGTGPLAGDWYSAVTKAQLVTAKTYPLEYRLTGRNLTIFKLAQVLASWNHFEDHSTEDKVPENIMTHVERLVRDLSSDRELNAFVASKLNEYRTSDSIGVVRTPERVYKKVRSCLYAG